MGKKNLTIEEMFCANFYLKSYFKNMEYKIKKSREMGKMNDIRSGKNNGKDG